MILWRLISWPYLRRHAVRSVLTTAGIVLGVAVFVGMRTTNDSVLVAFHRTVDRIAGKTELQVTAGDAGFPEAILERVQALPDVRVAVPIIEAPVETGLPGEGNILILAVDMTGDRSLRDYDIEGGDEAAIDDPLIFLAQPDSIIITNEFARRNGLTTGSRVPMRTMIGERQFVVRGIMRSGGLASAFGGNLAVMDIYAAQAVFGRGRTFDRLDLALKPGVAISAGQATLQKLLGQGYQVDVPSARGEQIDAVLRVYSIAVGITSIFALFIGMFIIYNSFAIAVVQRRSEVGILRALGATRRQIQTLFLGESVVAGLAGSLVGLGFGMLIARGMVTYISSLLADVYGVTQQAESIATDPRLMVTALAMGLTTSLVAAFLPARNAARADPIQALQKGRYQLLSAGENRIRRRVAAVLVAASVAALVFGQSRQVFYAGYVLMIVACLALTPTLALWFTRVLRPLFRWVLPVEGTLAADSLIQSPRRTSGTVAALMLSLALIVGLAGINDASYVSILDWLHTSLNPDLFVTSSQSLANRNFRFPASVGDELQQIPGVDEVQRVRSVRILLDGKPILVVSVELSGARKRAPRPAVEGDATGMYREAGAGRGVMLSQNLSGLHNIHLGDIVNVPTPTGVHPLPVVGVIQDWSDQQGTLFVDREVFKQWWQDDSVTLFRIYVKKGEPIAPVRRRILEHFSGMRRLFVLTNDDVRGYIERVADQWMGLSYAQIGVAVLVAVLGIVNTLTVSVMDRRRELGVLQAVGGLRNQIRRTIWMEAIAIGIVGLVLGLALGAVNQHYLLEMMRRDISGMRFPYVFPVRMALWLCPIILGSAWLAAIWPAESAVRGSLVEALEYE